MTSTHIAGFLWEGRPCGMAYIPLKGFLTRTMPALAGILVITWLYRKWFQFQTGLASSERAHVFIFMTIILIPLLAPCVFMILEPLRRMIFWRFLRYAVSPTVVMIQLHIGCFIKIFHLEISQIRVVSIRPEKHCFTVNFGELTRWFSYLGKNKIQEEFEFSCLNAEKLRTLMTICLEQNLKVEGYYGAMLAKWMPIHDDAGFREYLKVNGY